jgi:pimeloyl-ACP methyl ester carboxylesterase
MAPGRCPHRHGVFLAMIVTMLIVTALTGAVSDAVMDRVALVGRENIHIRCGGARTGHTPLVVLEAGAGDGIDAWREVMPCDATLTRVYAYDRPGTGSSPRGIGVVEPSHVVERLRRLLRAVGAPGAYVFVGHSYGGMIARLYERREQQSPHDAPP